MQCFNCWKEEVTVYCHKCDSDCVNKLLCDDCDKKLHFGGMQKRHNRERISTENRGVFIITGLFDEIMIFMVLLFLYKHFEITEDYFQGNLYCPWTSDVRGVVSRIDLDYVTYYREWFTKACGVEDSFFRFYFDGWVRSIVVGNDTIIGVYGGWLPAVAAQLFITKVGIPFIALIIAAIFWLLWQIESRLPREELFLNLAEVMQHFHLVEFRDEVPPVTVLREKSPRGLIIYDALSVYKYLKQRYFRVYNYYYNRVVRKGKILMYWSMVSVCFVRITSIFFGLPGMLLCAAVVLPTTLYWQHIQYSKTGWRGGYKRFVEYHLLEICGVTPQGKVKSYTHLAIACGAIAGGAAFLVFNYLKHKTMFQDIAGAGLELHNTFFWAALRTYTGLGQAAILALLQKFAIAVGSVLVALGGFVFFASRKWVEYAAKHPQPYAFFKAS